MEEQEKEKKVLEDVFGSSSSSSSSDSETEEYGDVSSINIKRGVVSTTNPNPNPNLNPCCESEREREWEWESNTSINGLWLCRHFLSPHHQSSLLSAIHNEGWFSDASHNQAMRFGDLPVWALELSDKIHEAVCFGDKEAKCEMLNLDNETCVLPPQLLWRDPFFDQLILNVYQAGEGICAHVDLMRFEDGIAIVSLESSCVMHFSPVDKEDGEASLAMKIPVHLTPGSLVIMWGDARYHWKHEINRKPGFQICQGQEIDQKRRTSITLRKLCMS